MCAKIINEFNKTSYSYTEGLNVENDIYNYIKNNATFEEVMQKDDRWTTFYHLNDIRKGIVSWFEPSNNSECLEIGGGMGAITSYLCENYKYVTSVEMSELRANAIYERNKDKENLDIIVGDLKDIKFKKKFDVIFLIGVLEYQGNYSNSSNPYVEFLAFIRKLLKPKGSLIVAIENRFGFKYFCGIPEDHTALPFDGINDYALSQKAKTFSRSDLQNIIRESGFKKSKFYYPLPDYKLPQIIYSDEYLPESDFFNRYREYYLDYRSIVINENTLLKGIIDNNVFPFFANSFLVECTNGDLSDVCYATCTGDREKKLQLNTIVKNDVVIKKALNDNAMYSIKESLKNITELKRTGINIVEHKLISDTVLEMPRVKYNTVDIELLNLAKKNKKKEFLKLINDFYLEIQKSSPKTENNYLVENNIVSEPIDCGVVLQTGYIDLLFHNCFCKENNSFVFFDQEFTEKNIPANFMIYRSLINLYYNNDWLEEFVSQSEIEKIYGIDKVKDYYNEIDNIFLNKLRSKTMSDYLYKHSIYDKNVIKYNSEHLLNVYNINNDKQSLENIKCALEEEKVKNNYLLKQNQELAIINDAQQKKCDSLEKEIASINNSKGYRIVKKVRRVLHAVGIRKNSKKV